jgi:CheY-specific phosphatase CheX
MNSPENPVFGTEDLLISLCNSVSKVLTAASGSQIHFSAMVQRITKTCLKPDIGCFVLFDGGFSGLVIINFSSLAAMELYERYMLNMGMAREDLASSHTTDEVGNVMGELMNRSSATLPARYGTSCRPTSPRTSRRCWCSTSRSC